MCKSQLTNIIAALLEISRKRDQHAVALANPRRPKNRTSVTTKDMLQYALVEAFRLVLHSLVNVVKLWGFILLDPQCPTRAPRSLDSRNAKNLRITLDGALIRLHETTFPFRQGTVWKVTQAHQLLAPPLWCLDIHSIYLDAYYVLRLAYRFHEADTPRDL